MFNLIWPIAVVVAGNCFYNICSKATPHDANLYLSLTIGYIIAAALCFILWFAGNHGEPIGPQMSKLNWASYALGASLIFLEIGAVSMYRVGWNMSTGPLLCSILSSVALIIMGVLVYKDAITMTKLIGMVICGIGVVLINK